ncbi:unnamed protein product [Nesidiocoris tenuis]|uniref:Uncharacterized protein n=1 Tax=Nesidiocoris tenuis TaxID=355587 RepID=A0A6H5FUP2_9HEMI|nr:unnamed protein product [Nesidiocoris tenuis]
MEVKIATFLQHKKYPHILQAHVRQSLVTTQLVAVQHSSPSLCSSWPSSAVAAALVDRQGGSTALPSYLPVSPTLTRTTDTLPEERTRATAGIDFRSSGVMSGTSTLPTEAPDTMYIPLTDCLLRWGAGPPVDVIPA